MQSQSRSNYISQKIELTLSSARDADKEITRIIKNRIKELLRNSLERNDHIKVSGQTLSLTIRTIGTILPYDWSKKLVEVGNEIIVEQKTAKDNLHQKFDRAIIKIDCMSVDKLFHVLKLFKKYELERILDYITIEPIQVKVLRKQGAETFVK